MLYILEVDHNYILVVDHNYTPYTCILYINAVNYLYFHPLSFLFHVITLNSPWTLRKKCLYKLYSFLPVGYYTSFNFK